MYIQWGGAIHTYLEVVNPEITSHEITRHLLKYLGVDFELDAPGVSFEYT